MALTLAKKLRKLQLAISPPSQMISGLASNVMESARSGRNRRDEALEGFLDLCEQDEGVLKVMSEHEPTRGDWNDIYVHVMANELGVRIKLHFAAISTIAYYEPLLFYVESQNPGTSLLETTHTLLNY